MAVIKDTSLKGGLNRRVDNLKWRWRYWYMDTPGGKEFQTAGFVLCALLAMYEVVRMALATMMPVHQEHTQKAVIWWVVQLIVMIVSMILSYVMRPKPPKMPEQKIDSPTVEDGVVVDDHFGEVWKEDEHILAWKVTKTEKIKSKGGKK